MSGNPKIRNRKETETRIGNPLIKENKFFKYNVSGKFLCELLPLNIREQVKKSSNKNSLSVEICATFISSEGYDCENLRACLHGGGRLG